MAEFTPEQLARIEMMFDLSLSVRAWIEGLMTSDAAMQRVHEALLIYKEAL